jgi:CRP/FNR family nitrogen fixation transcriptional regulator
MSTISDEAWVHFGTNIQHRRHGRRETVFRAGDPAERLYRVRTGGVKVRRVLPNGRSQILKFYGPGEWFGLQQSAVRTATAQTTAASVIESVPHRIIQAAANNEHVQQWLTCLHVRELSYLQDLVTVIGLLSAEERFRWFLAEQAPATRGGVQLLMTKGDLADHLALSPGTISRLIGRLTEEGSIKMTNGHAPVARYSGYHPVHEMD